MIPDPAEPANGMTTGSVIELAVLNRNPNPENLPHKRKSNHEDSKPAIEVITGFGVELRDLVPGGRLFPVLALRGLGSDRFSGCLHRKQRE